MINLRIVATPYGQSVFSSLFRSVWYKVLYTILCVRACVRVDVYMYIAGVEFAQRVLRSAVAMI
jgi:hypothetical protein